MIGQNGRAMCKNMMVVEMMSMLQGALLLTLAGRAGPAGPAGQCAELEREPLAPVSTLLRSNIAITLASWIRHHQARLSNFNIRAE